MTDDELRAEVNELIASGDNGEGTAWESDYLWAAFDKWWSAIGRGFMPITFNGATHWLLREKLGAAFEAGWDAHKAVLKGNRAQ